MAIGNDGEDDEAPASEPGRQAPIVQEGRERAIPDNIVPLSTRTPVQEQPTEPLEPPSLSLPSNTKTQQNAKNKNIAATPQGEEDHADHSSIPRSHHVEPGYHDVPSERDRVSSQEHRPTQVRPKKEEKPLLCETEAARMLLHDFRGWMFDTAGPIINENKIIHELCILHPLKHFQDTFHHLKTCSCKKHKWWHEDGHQRGLEAKNLQKLIPEILSELGMIPKPAAPPELVPPVPVRKPYMPVMPTILAPAAMVAKAR